MQTDPRFIMIDADGIRKLEYNGILNTILQNQIELDHIFVSFTHI